jgi:hypothetical protein
VPGRFPVMGGRQRTQPGLPSRPGGSHAITAGLCVGALAILTASVLWTSLDEGPEPARRTAAGTAAEANRLLDGVAPVVLGPIVQQAGPNYGLVGFHASGDKVQSKVWRAAGSWWGVLLNAASHTTHIYRYQDDGWRDTKVVVDPRGRSKADVVWTGGRLYIASRVSNGRLLLRRFRLTSSGAWKPLDPAPGIIASGGATTLSIDVDSRKRVWAVFNQGGRMWVTNSSALGQRFAAPRPLPRPASVEPDDIGAVVAMPGKIAILWSDQVRGAFRFVIRDDDDPPGAFHVEPPPVRGVRIADGHIHMVALKDGRLLAAVKTSLGDDVHARRSPLLVLLVRAVDGSWTRHTVATTEDQMTRPQIMLSADEDRLFLVATSPQTGGQIYLKVAATDTLIFPPGKGTVILDAPGAVINDATVARARVSSATGLLVLASDATHARYYTARIPLPPS